MEYAGRPTPAVCGVCNGRKNCVKGYRQVPLKKGGYALLNSGGRPRAQDTVLWQKNGIPSEVLIAMGKSTDIGDRKKATPPMPQTLLGAKLSAAEVEFVPPTKTEEGDVMAKTADVYANAPRPEWTMPPTDEGTRPFPGNPDKIVPPRCGETGPPAISQYMQDKIATFKKNKLSRTKRAMLMDMLEHEFNVSDDDRLNNVIAEIVRIIDEC